MEIQLIAGVIYLLLLLIFLAGFLIAVFHFVRYSYNTQHTWIFVAIFSILMVILIFANITLFYSLDLNKLFSQF